MQQNQNFIQEINNQLKNEIRERLTAIQFPFEKAEASREELTKVLGSILHKTSLDTLKVDLELFEQLVNEDYNLFSISFLLNSIPKLSASDLGLSVKEYAELIKLSYKLGKIHTELAKPIQEDAQEKYQKMADDFQKKELVSAGKEQKKKNKMVIPLNSKR